MMSTFINSKSIKWISNYVIDMSITMFKMLGLHLCNQENIPTHWLISPNNCINKWTWYEWLAMRNVNFFTNVEVNNPFLGDGDRNIVHNITKDLRILTLIMSHRIKIHHEKTNLIDFYNCHKMKTSFHWVNLIKAMIRTNPPTCIWPPLAS